MRSNYATRADIESVSGKVSVVQAQLAALAEQYALAKEHFATKEELARLSAKVDVIASNYVTREDLAKAINMLTWKMYGFGTALTAVVYFIARTVF